MKALATTTDAIWGSPGNPPPVSMVVMLTVAPPIAVDIVAAPLDVVVVVLAPELVVLDPPLVVIVVATFVPPLVRVSVIFPELDVCAESPW